MVSVLLVMLFIGAVINVFSYTVATRAISNKLTGIVDANESAEQLSRRDDNGDPSAPSFSDALSPSFNHNHFFVVTYNGGEETKFDTNSNDSEETGAAKGYAYNILNEGRTSGRYGNYYFLKAEKDEGTVVALLDCTSEIEGMLRLMTATFITCAAAFLITLVLVIVLSGKMIRPEIENANRQRQFITNASHELKTPLAVIRANTELIELTHGEDEWTVSTLKQIDHMNGLIQNLVMIARAEEKEEKSKMSRIEASSVVKDTVKPYEASAKQRGVGLEYNISDGVFLVADESKIRQLTTILVDNAVKYCDDGGNVSVYLSPIKKGKDGVRLTVANSFAKGEGVDCGRFFDRFYREDKSHNIDKGGYGIGLSIAQSICESCGGTIKATWKDGIMNFICQLP